MSVAVTQRYPMVCILAGTSECPQPIVKMRCPFGCPKKDSKVGITDHEVAATDGRSDHEGGEEVHRLNERINRTRAVREPEKITS